MPVVIVLIIAIIIIFIVVRKNKRKKALEELYHTAGHSVAVQIKDTLVRNGYEVGEHSISFHGGRFAEGTFLVKSNSQTVGEIHFSGYGFGLSAKERSIGSSNVIAISIRKAFREEGLDVKESSGALYYAIENDNIGVLVCSEQKTYEIPPFLEIAANVIISSGYVFKHPKWLYEEEGAKEYLNVMFQ
jgi:hypothetical protein